MNFEDYLLQGKILDALRYRVGVLQRSADKECSNCDGARLVSLGAIAISLPFVAPLPGVGVMAGIAGFSYLGTVWRDFQISGKLCLLPGSRIGAGDILSIFGLAGEEVSPREQQLMRVMDFLPYEQRVEYAVLVDDEPAIADLLKRLPAQDRLAGYAYMVRRMALGDVKALDWVEVKAAIAAESAEPSDSAPTAQLQRPGAALPAVEGSTTQTELSDRPAVNLALNPEINVHNHLGRYGSAAPKTASPAQAYRQTDAPDLTIYSDVRERMKALLKAMAQSGCPLGTLLNQPFCWFWGNSQSGKTTLATLLAIARMGMGHAIGYFSTDSDVAPLHWARMEDSPEGYSFALDDVARRISTAPKGSLKGEGWVFDEMFAAYGTYELELNPLLNAALMKLAKTCGTLIGISQVDTSGAHGLKNIDAAWRSERVSIQAIHEEDELGDRSPTGRYIVTRGDDSFEWSIPEWMLTELNEWGHTDPVVWLLNRFPELCQGQSNTQLVHHLEAVVALLGEPKDSADRFSFNALGTDLEILEKLFDDVVGEVDPVDKSMPETDEQILIAWFEKHPDQFYTKRQIVQMKVKVSQPERLEEQLIKLVKDGWLEVEETAQTTKFKWLPD
ncbi:hypothetical protein H6F88_00855 [Oculatella sp. FACHB-28]|uniref:hypothetical protein n=1 Tax=Oculatella sp. FACHB-28 TaxID=2692845 RepID=UPI0016869E2D|nr:hypothetical protein [Oculatella sp. FACHB-28]MBD2054592.1 hypothetical protein [Oculatella sp. FACHB-28]